MNVTVVVPTFNRASYIRESLDSILSQTIPPNRIIVVDDGSTDNTAEILDSYIGKVDYIRKENGGKSSAINVALRTIRSGLVWTFDDDDVALPGALEAMLDTLVAHPNADFVYGRNAVFGIDAQGGAYRYDGDLVRTPPHALLVRLLERMFFQQGAMLVKRRCFEVVGDFDTALIRSQDYDMALRLAHRFVGVGTDQVIYAQRRHSGRRGSASAPVLAHDIEDAWLRHDQLILRKMDSVLTISDFLAGGDDAQPPTGAGLFHAHLQRFTVYARMNCWAQAYAEMRAAAEAANLSSLTQLSPADQRALSRALDEHSRGLRDFHARTDLAAAVGDFSSPSLRRSVRRSIATPFPYALRTAIRNRDLARFRSTLRAMRSLSGELPALAALARILVSIAAGRMGGDADARMRRLEA